MKKLRIIHRNRAKLQKDNWTGGDWTQYVAFLDDGSAICCRMSGIPVTLAMIGFVLLSLPVMAAFMAYNGVDVIWPRIFETAFVGFALMGPWLVTWFTPWRMIVLLSEKMWPDKDGSYWRAFG